MIIGFLFEATTGSGVTSFTMAIPASKVVGANCNTGSTYGVPGAGGFTGSITAIATSSIITFTRNDASDFPVGSPVYRGSITIQIV